MNTLHLEYALKSSQNTASRFGGIYNNLNFIIKYDSTKYYIINTSINPNIMGHWVCFLFHNDNLIFIDSFGKQPSLYGGQIARYYNEYSSHRKYLLLNYQIQHNDSLMCGAYVYYFCNEIISGTSPVKYLSIFSKRNLKRNDKYVEKYLYRQNGSITNCYLMSCPYNLFFKKCRNKCSCS